MANPKNQPDDYTIDLGPFGTLSVTVVEPGTDPMEALEQAMHDCPECQAARARGEQPLVFGGDDLPTPGESRQMRRARERRRRRRDRREN